jgi:hypothetical protein
VLNDVTTVMNIPKANDSNDEVSDGPPMSPLVRRDDITGNIEEDVHSLFDWEYDLDLLGTNYPITSCFSLFLHLLLIHLMDNGGIGNEDNDRIRKEDNANDVLNEYLLEQMRLEEAGVGRVYDDEVSFGAGSGGGGWVGWRKMLLTKLLMLLLLSWTKLLTRP